MESWAKTPNAPLYIELVKNEVRDLGDSLEFKFHFAAKMTYQNHIQLWGAPSNPVSAVVWKKLKEKTWVTDGTEQAAKFMPLIDADASVTSDFKTWTLKYTEKDLKALFPTD